MLSQNFVIKGLMLLSLMAFSYFILINSTIISDSNQVIQNKQLQDLSRTMARQAALFAVDSIKEDNHEALFQLTNNLAKERLVFDATIYDAEGRILGKSDNALTASQITGLNTPLSIDGIGRQQLIEPIIKDDHLLGFLRLTFEKSTLTGFANHHYRKSDRLMFGMLAISLVSGMLIMGLLRKRKDASKPITTLFGGKA
ncbi:SMP protein [Aliivibrio fischeri]|uniref:SMP protein n=1 Tax=Aliivibrio fischeri TaxID=668 RepID=A0A6I3YPK8_ALIFS|nr:AhpA/YtjB family protein [Aliivibrio fischeri]MUK46757.1 SMP protein [Aliivibrio fischeri]MUK63432.1 SMP protein [Aliivibrio fischeri]MUK70504.1 SMP protein [Aliivibrio fischeri]MUK73924.1 SMP protein [Aliivibrio fischeri]MUK81135.1 SMP protein [Aliivibrio fischeri]